LKKLKLSDSGARGWFVGDFPEAVHRTRDFEVCWQPNSQDYDLAPHYHRVVTEIQLVVRGRMIVNDVEFGVGDICYLEPGDHYRSSYLEPTDVVAIKFPSVPNDKYLL
jgi:mannose-6-phosphate isomerase-like protein (cupin superfamily)